MTHSSEHTYPCSSVTAVFAQHSEAEKAIKTLKEGEFDVRKLSIIGTDYHSEENVIGFYNLGDTMKYWGTIGAFWGGLWGALTGSAFLLIPGLGPILAAGPVVAWIVAALEGAVVVGGVSAVGAGLVSLGVPKDSIVKYEASVQAGKFLLIAHGTPDEVQHARTLIQDSAAEHIHMYQPAREIALVK